MEAEGNNLVDNLGLLEDPEGGEAQPDAEVEEEGKGEGLAHLDGLLGDQLDQALPGEHQDVEPREGEEGDSKAKPHVAGRPVEDLAAEGAADADKHAHSAGDLEGEVEGPEKVEGEEGASEEIVSVLENVDDCGRTDVSVGVGGKAGPLQRAGTGRDVVSARTLDANAR